MMTLVPLVVVIENDLAMLQALSRVLRAGGFEPAPYRAAEEFLASPPDRRPLCLVLDLHLGQMSGFELQRRLERFGSTLPVVMMTAFDEHRIRDEALRAGCVGYFEKTGEIQGLLDLLRSLQAGDRSSAKVL